MMFVRIAKKRNAQRRVATTNRMTLVFALLMLKFMTTQVFVLVVKTVDKNVRGGEMCWMLDCRPKSMKRCWCTPNQEYYWIDGDAWSFLHDYMGVSYYDPHTQDWISG